MTSNIGTSQDGIGFGSTNDIHIKNKLKDFLGQEFVNRLDAVICFEEISDKTITKIIEKALKKACINTFSPELVEKIKKESDFTNYGVRKLSKIVDKYIEDECICNH